MVWRLGRKEPCGDSLKVVFWNFPLTVYYKTRKLLVNSKLLIF